MACAAALVTIRLLREQYVQNAAVVGERMMNALRDLQNKHQIIGDVRGLGLMIGMELVRDRGSKEPASAERDALVQACFQRGLLLLGSGVSTVRFCPPLVVTSAQCDVAVQIIDDVLRLRS